MDKSSRNEESPIKGIDTHKTRTRSGFFRSRNEESPIKGIDTIAWIVTIPNNTAVEMRKARLRALTHKKQAEIRVNRAT